MIEYEVIKIEVHDYDVTETGQRSQNLKTIEEARKVVLGALWLEPLNLIPQQKQKI